MSNDANTTNARPIILQKWGARNSHDSPRYHEVVWFGKSSIYLVINK